MKNIILLAFVLFTLQNSYSQTPNYQWAKSAGGTYNDYGYIITSDAIGNIYVTGFFYSSGITFGSDTLNNDGSDDVFIVKYDPNGNVIWAKSAGGSDIDEGYSVTSDALGNIYVTGSFYSSSITFGSDTLNNNGSSDVFIVKYDPNGNVIWAKSTGGIDNDRGQGVTSDASGNIYVTGSFYSSSITFGSDTLNNNNGSSDVFIVKYDPDGNVIWAKSAGGLDGDYGYGITSDATGNIYITGDFFSSDIIFGSDTLNNNGSGDVFIVKYDPNGNVIWAKSAGGTNYDWEYGITSDASGNIYVTGSFNSPGITFGSDTLNNNNNNGSSDVFIVKYDPNGNVIWAKSTGGIDNDRGQGVTSDANGNIYVTGSFDSPDIIFGSYTLNNNGVSDVFIVKLSEYPNTIENTFGSNFKIYPNPVNDYLYIELGKTYKNISVSVQNITGQAIMHKNFKNQDKLKLHIKGTVGIYFISLQTDTNEKAVFKVLRD